MFFTILGIAYLTACTTSWAVHKLISLSEYIRKKREEKEGKKEGKQDADTSKSQMNDKAMYLMQKEVDKHKDDNSEEAKEIREGYNDYLEIIYDENGNKRTQEEIDALMKQLPKERLDKIKKYTDSTSNDPEKLGDFNNTQVSKEDIANSKQRLVVDRKTITLTRQKEKYEQMANGDDKIIDDEIKKCQSFKAPLTINNFDSVLQDKSDKVNQQKAKDALIAAGIDPDIYIMTKNAGQDPKKIKQLKDDIKNKSSEKVKEINNQIQAIQNSISKPKQKPEQKPKQKPKPEPKTEPENPASIWHKKSYKRGNKTYQTKYYYDKNGNSISPEEFNDRMKKYREKKAKKESLLSYIYNIINEDKKIENHLGDYLRSYFDK